MTLGILYSSHKEENYSLFLIQLPALWKMSVSVIGHEVF